LSRKPSSEKPKANPNVNVIEVPCAPGEDVDLATARVCIGPYAANALALKLFAKGSTGSDMPSPAVVKALSEASKRVHNGSMKDVEAMLVTQAMSLNSMFADLSRRSAINLSNGSYFEAGERYFKMAMKAQNQCRMTLETLSTIKNPPVVYAKQANIAHGPQQVNNGTGPSRTEENQNAPNKLLERSNDTPMDTRAPSATGGSNSAMEAVGKIDRPSNR
jgi:hypothetical protein